MVNVKMLGFISFSPTYGLKDAKGFDLYFKHYLGTTNNFTPTEQQFILSLLPYLRDWYVQAGTSGMNATDTLNRGAFMRGGSGMLRAANTANYGNRFERKAA